MKRRKLAWFGHVNRHDSLAKTIHQGTVEGGRRRGRPRKAWVDNVKEWTGSAHLTQTPSRQISTREYESTNQNKSTFPVKTRTARTKPTGQGNPLRVRFGAKELLECFANTRIQPRLPKNPFLPKSHTGLKATRIYREVFALEGSIEAKYEFGKEEILNISQRVRRASGCKKSKKKHLRGDCSCALRIRVPAGLYAAVEIPVHIGSTVKLYDSRWEYDTPQRFSVFEDNSAFILGFIGSSSVVNILLNVRLHTFFIVDHFILRFKALRNPGLRVKRTAFNRGIIQTPLYQDQMVLLNPLLRPWARVAVPSGHVIVVSSPRFEAMSTNCVALHAADRGNETLARRCPTDPSPLLADVYDTSVLFVQVYVFNIKLYEHQSSTGLQFYFSFHNESMVLVKLADNSWNCSFPYRSDLLHHLSCNMEVECHDAEDEVNCSYTTDQCGPGYLTVGGTCFFLLRRHASHISARTAFEMCLQRGGRLASLNTVDKWKDAVQVLTIPRHRNVLVIVGIRNAPLNLPLWYKSSYQWADGTTAFYLNAKDWLSKPACSRVCGVLSLILYGGAKKNSLELKHNCERKWRANILCEIQSTSQFTTNTPLSNLPNGTNRWPRDTAYVMCPSGHYTHHFLVCDVRSDCWQQRDSSSSCGESPSLPPFFTCANQMERVPFTMVCDHRADCVDRSDEDFCSFPACRPGQFTCDNKQCIPSKKVCDHWSDCHNGEDEDTCESFFSLIKPVPPPALVTVPNLKGRLTVEPLNAMPLTKPGEICPATHFQCLDNGYCLPMFLRCNRVYDCPGLEDETGCDTCPGFYRCRASAVCLHHRNLCDGHAHCPQHDDELLCNSTCPPACACRGLAFFCTRRFTAGAYPRLRYLYARGSGVTPAELTSNLLLVHLTLADCGLSHLDGLSLPNLLSLDIGDNRLSVVAYEHFDRVPRLKELSVAGNPLETVFAGEGVRYFSRMLSVDLSRVTLRSLNVSVLSAFPSLHVLNLSHSGVQRVLGEGLGIMKQLRVVDLRGCPMTWLPRAIFQGLAHLQVIHARSFKLCCPAVLPLNFNLRNCFAPTDEISSCDNLLRGNEYSVCVFALSLVALVGNAVSFIFRSYVAKQENKLGYGTFVTHLSVSDFLMGVYLAVIGVADRVYRGTYLWNDVVWRHSVACKLAGFLSLLSSEVSVLIMCLITLDRFLVLRFPFSRLHFKPTSAHAASVVVWIGGVLLVSVPLLPMTSHWEFYSQTGICIPLPITRADFAGHGYSFSIMIVFNFVVFLVISLGQLSIYLSVRANSMSVSNTTKKTKDQTIARRLITVAMTDFLCWFPLGVLGLMASSGAAIPGEVNVAVAIFVLPLNSAVNPCLYTLNVILERRGRARDEKLRALLLAQLKTNN